MHVPLVILGLAIAGLGLAINPNAESAGDESDNTGNGGDQSGNSSPVPVDSGTESEGHSGPAGGSAESSVEE